MNVPISIVLGILDSKECRGKAMQEKPDYREREKQRGDLRSSGELDLKWSEIR